MSVCVCVCIYIHVYIYQVVARCKHKGSYMGGLLSLVQCTYLTALDRIFRLWIQNAGLRRTCHTPVTSGSDRA